MTDNVYVLSDSGHVAIARSIIEQTIFLAWGKLIPKLPKPTGVAAVGTTTSSATLPEGTHEYVVTAWNAFGETEKSQNAVVVLGVGKNSATLSWIQVASSSGYFVYRKDSTSGNMLRIATVTGGGTLSFVDTGLALGIEIAPVINTTSEDPWTNVPPAAKVSHTKLYNEVGRRRAITKKYVKPDPNGDIDTPKGRWSESSIPTRYVYIQVGYALTDASDQTLYQLGAFIGTVGSAGNENANYLLPNQIADAGTLFALSNVSPIYRNSSTREIRELVITF